VFAEGRTVAVFGAGAVLGPTAGRQVDLDIVAGGAGVGAGLVGKGDEFLSLGLIEGGGGDLHGDGEGEGAGLVGADGDVGCNGDLAGVQAFLGGDVLHGSGEAGGVPGSEELLGIGAGAVALAAEDGGSDELEVEDAVRAAGCAVATADRGDFGCVKDVHVAGFTIPGWGRMQMDRGTMAGIDESFARNWSAEVLQRRPMILPRRHFVYPAQVEEVERGALEALVRPGGDGDPFLATCALGFASSKTPTGVWTCPNPDEMCAVAGGYAYILDTRAPERWTQVEYRPVMEIRAIAEAGLLVFVGFHSVLAWGGGGLAWRSGRLSWEGVRLGEVRAGLLQGWGWDLRTDAEVEFAVELETGRHTGGPVFEKGANV
jgi:hypothetical protein